MCVLPSSVTTCIDDVELIEYFDRNFNKSVESLEIEFSFSTYT